MADTTPLKRLLSVQRHHRRRVVAAALCSVINKVLDLAPPILIGAAVDVVVQKEDSFIATMGQSRRRAALALALFTVLVWAGESVFEYLYGLLWRNSRRRRNTSRGGRLPPYPGPRHGVVRRPVARRADEHPQRRHQPA